MSALQVRETFEGDWMVPAEPLTAAQLTEATQQLSSTYDSQDGILVVGIHFNYSKEWGGFFFTSKRCLGIALKAMKLPLIQVREV